MHTMSATDAGERKEPYDDCEDDEEQTGRLEDLDQEEEDPEVDEDVGGLTESEREEIERLNSQIDFLNVALDDFEQKNSDLQQRLRDFLSQNSEKGSSTKSAGDHVLDSPQGPNNRKN